MQSFKEMLNKLWESVLNTNPPPKQAHRVVGYRRDNYNRRITVMTLENQGKWTGADIRAMNARNGVGRPPKNKELKHASL